LFNKESANAKKEEKQTSSLFGNLNSALLGSKPPTDAKSKEPSKLNISMFGNNVKDVSKDQKPSMLNKDPASSVSLFNNKEKEDVFEKKIVEDCDIDEKEEISIDEGLFKSNLLTTGGMFGN